MNRHEFNDSISTARALLMVLLAKYAATLAIPSSLLDLGLGVMVLARVLGDLATTWEIQS